MKFRHRSIMGLIYCCLLAIPMVSILSRIIYVQSNKNAKDSYYGETINQQEIILGYKDLQTYYNYQFSRAEVTSGTINYQVSNVAFVTNPNNIVFNQDVSEIKQIYVYLDNSTQIVHTKITYNNDGTQYVRNTSTQFSDIVLSFYLLNEPSNTLFSNFISYTTYNKYSYLDNAFDYSLSTFVDSNSWGNLDLFQWFTDLFLDMNTNNNGLYIHFVNWYMNYVLFVSCAYILFLVLMWFINYSRRILERGMNYDW